MYAQLDSPLPSLTVSPFGEHCCGMRGYLGQSEGDPLTNDFPPPTDTSVPDLSTLPLSPVNTGEPLTPLLSPADTGMIALPDTIGTEFVSNGDGTYTNIQTGQSVPMSTAQQITAATTGSATANVQTAGTEVAGSIVDPNTGATVPLNNLTAAAQALNAAGQLVNAAGKLTAQGQALLNAGNLYKAPPSTGLPNFSAAMSSLTSWFSGSTVFPGIPNAVVLAGGAAIAFAVYSVFSSSHRGRRKNPFAGTLSNPYVVPLVRKKGSTFKNTKWRKFKTEESAERFKRRMEKSKTYKPLPVFWESER